MTDPAHELDAYLRTLINTASDARRTLALGRDFPADLPTLVRGLSIRSGSVLLTRADALAYRDLASSLDRWDVVLHGPEAGR